MSDRAQRFVPFSRVPDLARPPIPKTEEAPARVLPFVLSSAHTRAGLRALIQQPAGWAVLSAERTGFSDHANAARTALLFADLAYEGFDPIAADGVYNGTRERAWIVPRITPTDALRFGALYGQESVLLPYGLAFLSGGSLPVASLTFERADLTDHTVAHCDDGPLYFAFALAPAD